MAYSVSLSNNNPRFMWTGPRDMPDFDGVKTEEKIFCDTSTEFKITLGLGKSQLAWDRQATVSFDDFAEDLSQSPVGSKDGSCYVPATFRGINRKKNDADEIGIAPLDADCGHSFERSLTPSKKLALRRASVTSSKQSFRHGSQPLDF